MCALIMSKQYRIDDYFLRNAQTFKMGERTRKTKVEARLCSTWSVASIATLFVFPLSFWYDVASSEKRHSSLFYFPSPFGVRSNSSWRSLSRQAPYVTNAATPPPIFAVYFILIWNTGERDAKMIPRSFFLLFRLASSTLFLFSFSRSLLTARLCSLSSLRLLGKVGHLHFLDFSRGERSEKLRKKRKSGGRNWLGSGKARDHF